MPPHEHFRAVARYGIDLPVAIRHAPGSQNRKAVLVDLSLAGARLRVAGDLPPGSSVVLELKMPTLWDPLVINATVAWSRADDSPVATEAGVKFTHPTPAAVAALFDLLGTQEFETR